MLSYCLKSRKKTDSKSPRVDKKTKKRKINGFIKLHCLWK